jgi:hypothetical protein
MKLAVEKARTGFLAGSLLLLFAFSGLFSVWLAPLAGTAATIRDFPAMLAIACGYCALVALLSSVVDRADGDAAVGAYRLIGRWFVWAGAILAAFSIGLVATATRYADDLRNPDKLFFVAAVSVPLIVIFAYLLQRSGKARPPAARKEPAPGWKKLKAGLAIVLCLVAGVMLYQRYTEKLAREAGYDARDEAIRRASKPWSLDFDAFHGGMSVQEVGALARTTGHALRCHGDLRSEERITKDDTNACSLVVGEAWGIPALWTQFNFGEDGLRYQFIRFPEASWPQIEEKLGRTGKRLPQTFGTDPETRGPIYGWRFDSGLVNSARAPRGKEVTVAWTPKRYIVLEYCARQGAAARRDPQRHASEIKELWPEIDCTKLR